MLDYIKGQLSVTEEIGKLIDEKRNLLEMAEVDSTANESVVNSIRSEFCALIELKRRLTEKGIDC